MTRNEHNYEVTQKLLLEFFEILDRVELSYDGLYEFRPTFISSPCTTDTSRLEGVLENLRESVGLPRNPPQLQDYTCDSCHGNGKFIVEDRDGHIEQKVTCTSCLGTGRTPNR